jgi:hypothetical protein
MAPAVEYTNSTWVSFAEITMNPNLRQSPKVH